MQIKDFIFDFGSLEPSTELLYITSMVSKLPLVNGVIDSDEVMLISLMIHRSQVRCSE